MSLAFGGSGQATQEPEVLVNGPAVFPELTTGRNVHDPIGARGMGTARPDDVFAHDVVVGS